MANQTIRGLPAASVLTAGMKLPASPESGADVGPTLEQIVEFSGINFTGKPNKFTNYNQFGGLTADAIKAFDVTAPGTLNSEKLINTCINLQPASDNQAIQLPNAVDIFNYIKNLTSSSTIPVNTHFRCLFSNISGFDGLVVFGTNTSTDKIISDFIPTGTSVIYDFIFTQVTDPLNPQITVFGGIVQPAFVSTNNDFTGDNTFNRLTMKNVFLDWAFPTPILSDGPISPTDLLNKVLVVPSTTTSDVTIDWGIAEDLVNAMYEPIPGSTNRFLIINTGTGTLTITNNSDTANINTDGLIGGNSVTVAPNSILDGMLIVSDTSFTKRCAIIGGVSGSGSLSGYPFLYNQGGEVSATGNIGTILVRPFATKDVTQMNDLYSEYEIVLDGNTIGLNGLDTGTLAANSLYYIFVIGGPTVPSGVLLSLSLISPVLPTDYTWLNLKGNASTDSAKYFTQPNLVDLKGYLAQNNPVGTGLLTIPSINTSSIETVNLEVSSIGIINQLQVNTAIDGNIVLSGKNRHASITPTGSFLDYKQPLAINASRTLSGANILTKSIYAASSTSAPIVLDWGFAADLYAAMQVIANPLVSSTINLRYSNRSNFVTKFTNLTDTVNFITLGLFGGDICVVQPGSFIDIELTLASTSPVKFFISGTPSSSSISSPVSVTGTSKTLSLLDVGTLQICNNAATQTITFPLNTTTDIFPFGGSIEFAWIGVGQPIFTNAVGVTLTSSVGSLPKLATVGATCVATVIANNSWLIRGGITA